MELEKWGSLFAAGSGCWKRKGRAWIIHVRLCVFKSVLHFSGRMLRGIRSLRPLPAANPHFPLLAPLSPLTSRAFTLLTENNESGCGMCISAAKNFHCIFRHFLEKQRMFCWGPFSSSASVIPIRLPSVPAYGSPRAKPQEMRYWYGPREVRKGHLFHRCRWQNSRRKPRGQGKYERGRAREEMRYGKSKRAGCVSFVAY